MITQGAVFGFEATSDVPLRLTRKGSGTPLHITTHSDPEPTPDERLIVEWKPRPGHPFHGRVHQNAEGRYRVWTNDAGWYLVDPEHRTIALPENGDELQREVRLWSTPMMLLLITEGRLLLHASAVQIGGEAVLFGGPSRSGKTTLAAAFHARGYRVLAEDTACLMQENGRFSVLPGPAVMRIRHDVASTLQLRHGTSIGEDGQRVFFIPDEPGTAEPVPLRGLFLLRDVDLENSLQALDPDARLLPDLWTLSFKIPTENDYSRSLSNLVDLTQTTTFWNLHRPSNVSDLFSTIHEIEATLS